MKITFFDDDKIGDLYPLSLTRPAADLRCGILTLAEKWAIYLNVKEYGYETRDYLRAKFNPIENADIRINGRVLPNPDFIYGINHMQPGETLFAGETILATKGGGESFAKEFTHPVSILNRPFDIFMKLGVEIERDIAVLVKTRHPFTTKRGNSGVGAHSVYFEDGAKATNAFFNTEKGAIYLGKNAEVMEGCVIRGPFSMGEGSVLKQGTKVYGPSALGPFCTAGGEINNIQMQAYSNKGHDGFLGNAAIGEWCNIGADSNCSNLKNNYEEVKVWNYNSGKFDKSGQQFCGLIMGDHSKCGINTMFNTGTVVGVSANIFGSGFPRQFIPDFAWGGASGFITYKLDAACKTASLVFPRRKKVFDATEKAILEKVFEITGNWRNWEKDA